MFVENKNLEEVLKEDNVYAQAKPKLYHLILHLSHWPEWVSVKVAINCCCLFLCVQFLSYDMCEGKTVMTK